MDRPMAVSVRVHSSWLACVSGRADGCGHTCFSREMAPAAGRYPKFEDLHDRLSDHYPSAVLDAGSLDITVDGEVRATFFKSGRLFDVELT